MFNELLYKFDLSESDVDLNTVQSVVGNINKDSELKTHYEKMAKNGKVEKISITRFESQRTRMRKTSDKGVDYAILMPAGTTIHHGDILLSDEERVLIVDLAPENVVMITVKELDSHHHHHHHAIEIPVRIGHTIGNLHRPIKIEGNRIYFPIQADSEVDMFKNLFHSLLDHVVMEKTRIVFEAEGDVPHEH